MTCEIHPFKATQGQSSSTRQPTGNVRALFGWHGRAGCHARGIRVGSWPHCWVPCWCRPWVETGCSIQHAFERIPASATLACGCTRCCLFRLPCASWRRIHRGGASPGRIRTGGKQGWPCRTRRAWWSGRGCCDTHRRRPGWSDPTSIVPGSGFWPGSSVEARRRWQPARHSGTNSSCGGRLGTRWPTCL